MNKDFSKLCTPAKIYFVIAVIACIFALFNGMGVVSVFVKLVFAFIWAFMLSWLCNKGYKSLSWFLVLLPYFIILLALIGYSNSTLSSYGSMMAPGYSPGYGSNMMYPSNMMYSMNGAGMKMPMMGSGMM
jgi:hypothetical protein